MICLQIENYYKLFMLSYLQILYGFVECTIVGLVYNFEQRLISKKAGRAD
jgi:hypothetical protein